MDWQKYIHSDVEVLSGEPVVEGTRFSAEFLFKSTSCCQVD